MTFFIGKEKGLEQEVPLHMFAQATIEIPERRKNMEAITAISTPAGHGGIGIVRVSGKDSFKVVEKIFKPKNNTTIKGYTMKYGTILDENSQIIDEVLVSYFVAPKSYTTEDMCEINTHGNQIVLNKILQLCIDNGARLAEPGEFTKQAFLNGRIDLSQAESVIDLINAKTEKEQEIAISQLKGFLSEKINEIKKRLLDCLADIEASIDYPEYDIEERTSQEILSEVDKIIHQLVLLENSFNTGKLLRDGVNVAIVGRPNAGKSSLLNAILKEDRAIVTNIEGTTRDTIEEFVTIHGILFKLIDTAGIRESENEIEKIGIDKSRKALKKADLVIAIFDSTKHLIEEDEKILEAIKDKNAIILLNKSDLNNNLLSEEEKIQKAGKDIIEISALKKEGIDKLYTCMEKIFHIGEITIDHSSVITNQRHKAAIKNAKEAVGKVIDAIQSGVPVDITAIYFKDAIEELNKITGENVTEDIINQIFSKFCLGK